MNQYTFEQNPIWTPSLTDKDLLDLVARNKDQSPLQNGKRDCLLLRTIFCTSATSNQEYYCKVYTLSTPDILQAAGVFEELVFDDEYLLIHRISVIRNGEVLDKTANVHVRILDNESQSHNGVIDQLKKVNFTIQGLQINDVFVSEYTKVKKFKESNFVSKKFFRCTFDSPAEYWMYRRYELILLNEREEDLVYCERFLRDEKGEVVKNPDVKILHIGESFQFTKDNYTTSYPETVLRPFFEFATQSSWEDISNELFPFYEDKIVAANNIDFSEYLDPSLLKRKEEDAIIRGCIEYVQNNITYLFNAEDMHGHVPQNVEATLQEKTGDCKAKSLLLVSMLKSFSIEAHMVLVHYAGDFLVPTSFPSPFLFNHVIVRILYKGQAYFVDPTWNAAYGLLPYRLEPFFFHFLPVTLNAFLEKNDKPVWGGYDIEEDISVTLTKDNAAILENVSTYRKGVADVTRKNLLVYGEAQLLKNENQITLERMERKDMVDTDFLFNGTLEKVSDNLDTNEIVIRYKTYIKDPYQQAGNEKIFKYYYVLYTEDLFAHRHKDISYFHTVKLSHKATLHISSDLYTDTSNKTTKKTCSVDNDYFSFSNKKEIKPRKTKVTSIYTLKKQSAIPYEDLELLKKEYLKVTDSNYGVGLVQGTFFRRYILTWYGIFWIIFICAQILRIALPVEK